MAAPAAAHEVDPTLPDYWERLLAILGTRDAARGPHEALGVARPELRMIAEHRKVARDQLRVTLMGVEARWAVFAGWLCEDTGDRRVRAALVERALCLAREADHPDLVAWARTRQAQWSDTPRAIHLAEAGMRTPRAGAHACAVRRPRSARPCPDRGRRGGQPHARRGTQIRGAGQLSTACGREPRRRRARRAPLGSALLGGAGASHRRRAVRRGSARLAAWLEARRWVVPRTPGARVRGRRRPRPRPCRGTQSAAIARATNSSVAVGELTALITVLRA